MSKRGVSLRALVTERLSAAAEDIFALVERTIAEYEEELCRSKEENQRKQQLLDEALGPQLLLHRTETQQCPEEQPEQSISQLPHFPAVCVKSEEQVKTEHQEETQGEDWGAAGLVCSESHGHFHSETEEQTENSSDTDNDEDWERPASTSSTQMETEADGDHNNQVQMKDTSSAAHNAALSTKYKSAPQTSATVPDGHTSGTRGTFECPFCTKIFAAKHSLKTHTTVHTGERPYSCSECDKTFISKSHLKDHMSVHTKEKPFTCLVCEKSFTRLFSLQGHMKLHTGERPYSCSTCNKTFSRRYHLKVHESTHTGEKPFSCSLCLKTFVRKDQMQVHMRTRNRDRRQDEAL